MSSRLHTFGYDGPVIPWTTFGEHLDFLSDVGHTPNLAWFVGHNSIRLAAGVSGSHPTEAQLRTMDGFMREAMEAGALGMSTGLEFNPGREATTGELVRLNAIAGEYDGLYTSHVRNRDSGILHAIAEFLEVARAGGARAEISHLNVRHNTGAPDRGWERAVEMMAAAREEGMDVLADTTPFLDGLGQLSGILPPWVAADGADAAVAKLRDPDTRARLRTECDRYWRFIHRGEWDRVRLQASEQHPDWDGLTFAQIADLRKADPWDCFFDVLADAGTAYESILVVGRLFTDEHMAEMISHPLFCLGVDTFTVTLDGPLADVLRHPLGYAGHVHYLTHHVRENGTLRLEEAIRKMTSMPAAHFGLWDRGLLRAGYAADVVVFDYDELDDVSTIEHPHAYARGVEHVLVNGAVVVDAGEHTGARPGRHLLARDDRPPLGPRVGSHRRDVGGDARGRARLGDGRRGPVREPALRAGGRARSASRLRRGCRRAGWRISPRCSRSASPATASCWRRPRTCSPPRRWAIAEIARLEPRPLWAPDGRMDPAKVEELIAENQAALLILENTHTRAGGTTLSVELTEALAAAAKRHYCRVHLDGARLVNASVALGVPLAELAAPANSVALSLNKGLSAPMGTVLAGSEAVVERARLMLQRLGGASVHRAGIAAAAGLVALETMVDRIADDHRRARELGRLLAEIPGLHLRPDVIETNIVFVEMSGTGLRPDELLGYLAARGVRAMEVHMNRMRFVTHRLIDDAEIERAVAIVAETVERHAVPPPEVPALDYDWEAEVAALDDETQESG